MIGIKLLGASSHSLLITHNVPGGRSRDHVKVCIAHTSLLSGGNFERDFKMGHCGHNSCDDSSNYALKS